MKTKLVYFAWVREKIGRSEEEIDLPENVVTVGDLLNHLKTMGEEYEAALEYDRVVRLALDQEHAHHTDTLSGVREIGIFPPMTGG